MNIIDKWLSKNGDKKIQLEVKKETFINYVYEMNLQNLNGREDFEEAFLKGIECAYDEIVELNKQLIVKSLVCVSSYKNNLTLGKSYEILNENKFNDYKIKDDLGNIVEFHRSWFDWKN